MINLKIKATFLLLVLSVSVVFSQVDSVKYEKGVELEEGIYITINDFRSNAPKLYAQNFEELNPDYSYSQGNFEAKVSSPNDTIYYPDSGVTKGIMRDSLFGYSDKYNAYYFMAEKVIINPINRSERRCVARLRYRIKYIGKICYMYKEDDYIKKQFTDNNDIIARMSTNYNYETANNAPSYRLLVDFNNWRTKEFSIKNFSELLKIVDESIYKEFMALSKSMRKKSWFIYLEKVNKAHPVYFPVNK